MPRLALVLGGFLTAWPGPGAVLIGLDDPPTVAPPVDPRTAFPEALTDWVIHRGDQRLSGVARSELGRDLEVLWTYQAGGPIISPPVMADGRAYFGSDDMKVHCVDVATGNGVWNFATGEMIEAPPLVHGGTVFIGSGDFVIYALDATTGELQWKRETDEKVVGGANWFLTPDGASRIVVGSHDNRLYCLDAKTGDVAWTYQTDERVNATPAIIDGRIIFGGCDSRLHVVDANTGAGIAKIDLGEEANVAGSVAVDGNEVYVPHMGNEFIRVDLQTGRVAWRFAESQFPFYGSPALGKDRVVFAGRDRMIHCVRRDNGEEIWNFPTRRKVDGSPVICGEVVVIGSGDGRVSMLSLEDGSLIWSYDIGQPVYSSPAVAGGVLLIGANDGRLYAFGSKSPTGAVPGRRGD